jgi:hypothetical protein
MSFAHFAFAFRIHMADTVRFNVRAIKALSIFEASSAKVARPPRVSTVGPWSRSCHFPFAFGLSNCFVTDARELRPPADAGCTLRSSETGSLTPEKIANWASVNQDS